MARLEPQKNPELLAEACSALQHPAELLIAGEGSLRPQLEKHSGVTLLGVRSDIPELMADADVFALSSDYEGHPVALLEAMAAGLPVVATAVGGVPEIVGDAGLLVPPRDIEAFRNALVQLQRDPSLREELSRRARERARSLRRRHNGSQLQRGLRPRCGAPIVRLAMLSTNMARGGAETQVARLAIELRRRGHSVSITSLRRPSAYVEEIKDAGVALAKTAVVRQKPQILHCHMFHANILGRLLRTVFPFPVVISTIHSTAETKAASGGQLQARDLAYRLTDFLADAVVGVSTASRRATPGC